MTVLCISPQPTNRDIHHLGMLFSHADAEIRSQGIELAAAWGGVRFEADLILRHGAMLTWGRDSRKMRADLRRLIGEGGHGLELVEAMAAAGGLAIVQFHHGAALRVLDGGLKPGFQRHESHLLRALQLAEEQGHPYTAACLRFWLVAFTTKGSSTGRALACLLCGVETFPNWRAA